MKLKKKDVQSRKLHSSNWMSVQIDTSSVDKSDEKNLINFMCFSLQ